MPSFYMPRRIDVVRRARLLQRAYFAMERWRKVGFANRPGPYGFKWAFNRVFRQGTHARLQPGKVKLQSSRRTNIILLTGQNVLQTTSAHWYFIQSLARSNVKKPPPDKGKAWWDSTPRAWFQTEKKHSHDASCLSLFLSVWWWQNALLSRYIQN